MSDKGAMIELRIDNGRISRLAPLHETTTIASPTQRAGIVALLDAEFCDVALQVQSRILALAGVELEIIDEADFSGAHSLPGHLIAIGHAGNNQLIRRLQYLQHLSDTDYPSEGLRAMSVHDPLGDGHNVVALLGRSAQVASASADRMLGRLTDCAGALAVAGRLYEIEPHPETPDPEELLRQARQAGVGAMAGRPSTMLTALSNLNLAGEERWARAFIELVTPYAVGDIPLSFWLMSAVDFWTQRLVTAWDRAEEFPYFSDEERLLVANFIASCTEYCNDSITYQKWRITGDEHQIFNHHTFPAWGLYFGCMYLRRHGYEVADLDEWLDKSRRVFERAALAGRSFDEGGAGYSWLVGNHLLEVSLAKGDTSYAESDKLGRYADLATCIQNNSFELVPFGDCGGYHGSGAGAASILLRAAEFLGDPGCKWVAEQTAPGQAHHDILASAVPAAPPDRHVGLFILPMDPVIHRWTGLPRFPNYPEPYRQPNIPAKRGFDKISMRGAWDADADYLLLQGWGDGQHGHPDANAISQYQVRGRLFLAESDYIRRWPKQHNMVMVINDGQHGTIPVTARLDDSLQFSAGAMTRTSLVDYNGCDWTRTILWLSGDCVLVVDSITARTEGEYELRCYWRTLGDVELTQRGMHADHDGEHFHVVELTDSDRRLDTEAPPLNTPDYPKYNFGDAVPKILSEKRSEHLQAGESTCFVNLLLPTGADDTMRREIKWAQPGTVLLTGEGPMITFSEKGFQIEGKGDYCFGAGNELPELRQSKSRCAPTATAGTGASASQCWSAELPAPAACLAPSVEGTLIGCEDGSVVAVSRSGESRLLARADDRIGALAEGRLFGEDDPTLLIAGYDSKLRALWPDGSERFAVELPRESHMPAWGKALCLADLDGDGRLWPIVGTAAWRVHAVDAAGKFRWTFDTAAHAVTCLATGDLNGDGRDEIAVGTVYFCVPAINADGGRLWQDEDYNDYWTAGPNFPFIEVADVDADGQLEVITVASDTLIHCIDHLGEKKWTYSIGDDPAGLTVAANSGIVAASMTGDVHKVTGNGERIWRTSLGSPCTALAPAGEMVCVATENGELHWLDAEGNCVARAQAQGAVSHMIASGDGCLRVCAGNSVVCFKV